MITIPFSNTSNTYVDSVLAHVAFLLLTYSLNIRTKALLWILSNCFSFN